MAAGADVRCCAGRVDLAAVRRRSRFERRSPARGHGDRPADRHRRDSNRRHGQRRHLCAAQPPGGPLQAHRHPRGILDLRAGGYRPAGAVEPDRRRDARPRDPRRVADRVGQRRDGRDAQHRGRPGDRQLARHRDAAQRPAGDRTGVPVGPGDRCAGRRPEHEQELSDRHDLGRRWPGQRHDLHHGRRHVQRSVQQPQPADAESRRAAGVQGREQRAAGPVRPPRRLGGQRRHEVGLERLPRQRFRLPARLPPQREERVDDDPRQPRAQAVRRHAWWAGRAQQAALLRGLPGHAREDGAVRHHGVHANAGDAQRRLHGVCVCCLPEPRCGDAQGAVRQQPDRSVAVQQGSGQHPQVRACGDRPVRALPVWRAQRQQRAPGARPPRLPGQPEPLVHVALHVRALRERDRLGRQERAADHAHGPREHRPLAHRRPQLDPRRQGGQRAASHVQQDPQRSPAARVLRAQGRGHRRRRRHPRLHGPEHHVGVQSRRRRHEPGVLQLHRLPDCRRLRLHPRQAPDRRRRQLHPDEHRGDEQPSDQRRVHVQRLEHGAGPRRLHGREDEQLPAGQPGVGLPPPQLLRDVHPGRLEAAGQPHHQLRPALGAIHPDPEREGVFEQLQHGVVPRRHPQHRVPAGPGGADVPGRRRVSRRHRDARGAVGAGRPARGRDLEPARGQLDERARGVRLVLRHAAPVLQHAFRQQPALGRAAHADQSGRRPRQSLAQHRRRQPVAEPA